MIYSATETYQLLLEIYTPSNTTCKKCFRLFKNDNFTTERRQREMEKGAIVIQIAMHSKS